MRTPHLTPTSQHLGPKPRPLKWIRGPGPTISWPPLCSFRSFFPPHPSPIKKTIRCALPFSSAAPIRGAGPDPDRLRPRMLAGAGGGGPARVREKPSESGLSRGALKLAPPPAQELRPTLFVTKGAQPMSEPERPGLRAKHWEGERREGAGSRGRATFD